MKNESDRQMQVRRRGRMGKRSETTMLIVRTDQRGQPTTPRRKKRPVITISKNAETAHEKGLRLANSASLFSLKDRFTASHCVT